MQYTRASASERRYLPPAVAVSTVAFALHPPDGATLGDATGEFRDSGGAPGGAPDAGISTGAGSTPTQDAATQDAAAQGEAVTLWIPLVRRTRPPFEGRWALPGGPTEWNETLVDTALRTLHGAVLRPPGYLEQLYSFGSVERSADAQRLVTIAYWALYGERDIVAQASQPAGPSGPGAARRGRWDDPAPAAPGGGRPRHAGADASAPRVSTADASAPGASDIPAPDGNVAWFSADALPPLAFDHADIVDYALWRLRLKTEYSTAAYRFLGPVFTLAQLRQVHEAILGQRVDPANFRRQALAQGHLVDTGEVETGVPYRPARLYRFRADPGHDFPNPERRSTP